MSKRRESNSITRIHESSIWAREESSFSWEIRRLDILGEQDVYAIALGSDQYNLASKSGKKGFEDREYTEQVTERGRQKIWGCITKHKGELYVEKGKHHSKGSLQTAHGASWISFLYKSYSIPDHLDWKRSSESLEHLLLSLTYHTKTVSSWNFGNRINPNIDDKDESQ